MLAGLAGAPVFADPASVSLSLAVRGVYDSNIYRLSPGEQRRFEYPSFDDYSLTPQGAVVVTVPVSAQELQLRAAGGYRFHRYNQELDSEDFSLLGRWRWALSDVCSGVVEGERTRRLIEFDDNDGDDIDDPPPPEIIRGQRLLGDGGCAITPELRFAASGEYQDRTNRKRRRSIFDLEETTFAARLQHGIDGTARPFAAIRYRERAQPNYPSRVVLRRGGYADIWDYGGGVDWAVSPFLTLAAEAYYTRLREREGRRDDDSLTYGVSADWEVTAKTRLRLFAEQGKEASPSIGAIAYDQRTQGGQLIWTATPRLTATFDLRYREREILRDRFPRRIVARTRLERDRTLSVGGTLVYALTDALDLRGVLNYRDRDANFFDLRFSATVATLGIAYRFAGPAVDTGLFAD